MTDRKILNSALQYMQKYSFSVIPVQPHNKVPAIQSWVEFQQRRATEEEIRNWWTQNPEAMIGIVQGIISGTCVVDLDTYKKEYDAEKVNLYFPDSVICPTAVTARGGWQLWFRCTDPNLRSVIDWLPACDFKANGGYVVVPPSHGTAGAYEWMPNMSLDDLALIEPPDTFLSLLNSINIKTSTLINSNSNSLCVYGNEKQMFIEGRRDEDMFHVAHQLIKAKTPYAEILTVLEILAKSCTPPFPASEIPAKIKSAIERASRKERNLSEATLEILALQKGYIRVTDLQRELQCVTESDKSHLRVILHRLVKDGILERSKTRFAEYRIIDREIDEIVIDGTEDEEAKYPVWLPFNLHNYVEISEGNEILIAGEHNSGKTAIILNILKENKNKIPIQYMTSEMRKSEFLKRFRGFTDVPKEFWVSDNMTKYIHRSTGYQDAIMPDALNIIDYMELDDYSQTEQIMREIHDKLRKGIAIIAVQKKKGQQYGRGGDMLMGKPRLAISIYKGDEGTFIAEITKAKATIGGNHDYKQLRFELTFGSKIRQLDDGWTWTNYIKDRKD